MGAEMLAKVWLIEARVRREGTLKWGRWKLLPDWHGVHREATNRKDWIVAHMGDKTEHQARVVPFDRRRR